MDIFVGNLVHNASTLDSAFCVTDSRQMLPGVHTRILLACATAAMDAVHQLCTGEENAFVTVEEVLQGQYAVLIAVTLSEHKQSHAESCFHKVNVVSWRTFITSLLKSKDS